MARAAGRGSTAAPQSPATAADLGLMVGSPPEPHSSSRRRAGRRGRRTDGRSSTSASSSPPRSSSRGTGPCSHSSRPREDLSTVRLDGVECSTTLEAFLQATYTDGFLVLRDGAILCERYFNGMRPATRHVLHSVSKSLCGVLAGTLAESGAVDLGESRLDLRPGALGLRLRRRDRRRSCWT